MDKAPAPAAIQPLLDEFFARIQTATGWPLTTARAATLEIVRDGRRWTLYARGKWDGRDLDPSAS